MSVALIGRAILVVGLVTGLAACAPLIVGGVLGYEIEYHHNHLHKQHFPMGVHR